MTECSSDIAPLPDLTWKSWMLLIVFLLMLIPIAHPFQLKLHPSVSSRYLKVVKFDFMSSSLMATLLLICMTAIDGEDIKMGIIGNANIQPYAILIFLPTFVFQLIVAVL